MPLELNLGNLQYKNANGTWTGIPAFGGGSGSASIHIGPNQPTNGAMYWLDTSDAIQDAEEPDTPVVPEEPEQPSDSAELMSAENIVATDVTIRANAQYSLYDVAEKSGSNAYEIPVEAGVTYKASITSSNSSGMPYWSSSKLDAVKGDTEFAVSAQKLTDFSVGRHTDTAFNGDTVVDTSTAATAVNNGDGTYTRSITFTPAISGYLYTCSWTAANGNAYSIKKVV